MKMTLFSLLAIPIFSFFQIDQRSVARELKGMFASLRQHTDSIYLADTINSDLTFDYEELKAYVQEKDTSLLRGIIDSGSRETLPPDVIQCLLLPYKVRILSKKDFNEIKMPELKLNRKELEALNKVDSLERYINFNSPDSFKLKPLYSKETKLMRSHPFKSYLRKRERLRKRIMFFYPLLKFRTHILMVMVYYNSMTNSATKVKLFSTSLVI